MTGLAARQEGKSEQLLPRWGNGTYIDAHVFQCPSRDKLTIICTEGQ